MSAAAPLPIGVLLLELAGIILAARVFATVAKRFGQPAVVGEILAGILLGKTVFDHIGSGYTATLWPAAVLPSLGVLAAVGLVLYMVVVGIEVDLDLIRGREKAAAGISLGSIVVPFSGGILLSLWLFSRHDTGKGFLAFALFVGAAMSITAFPVLARILTERGMHRTELGGLTLASAAVDDIAAWVLLAGVVIIADNGADDQWHLFFVLPYLLVMFLVVRPLLRRLALDHARAGRLEARHLATVLVGAFGSAWCTDWLGIHYIFGAFLFGAMLPRAGATELLRDIVARIEQVAMLLLLPVFFIVTGLNVDVLAIRWDQFVELLAVLAVAILGKFIGAFAGARLSRIRPRRASAVAVLMNTRGLTELVILAVGRDKHILDDQLYTLLVIMAITTTVMTGPILRRVYPDRWVARDVADAERRAVGLAEAYRVVVAVSDVDAAPPAIAVARHLIGARRPAEIVLSSVVAYGAVRMEVGSGLRSELLEVAARGAALQTLAVEEPDVPTTVLTRLGDDVAGELAGQLVAIDADVVITCGPGAVTDALVAHSVAEVVTVCCGSDGAPSVVARCGGGDDGDSTVEVALRLACAMRVPLVLLDNGTRRRRVAAIGDALRRAGVGVVTDGHTPDGAVVVSSHGDPAGASVLVRAEHDRRPTDWFEVGRRVAAVGSSF